MINKIKNQKFITFVFVGTSAFVTDILTLNILFNVFKFDSYFSIGGGVNIYYANMLAMLVSLVVNFSLNKFLTFENRENAKQQIYKFSFVVFLNYILNNIIFGILFGLTQNLQLSKILSTGSQVIWTFFLYKYFVFKFNKIDTKSVPSITNVFIK